MNVVTNIGEETRAALTAAGKQHCLKYMETYFYRTYLNALIA